MPTDHLSKLYNYVIRDARRIWSI